MAKRKRLTPPRPDYLAPNYLAPDYLASDLLAANPADPAAPQVKSAFPPLPSAPIAQVAGDAATSAALREVSRELASARAEGRLMQRLALSAIDTGHLVRDRIAFDEPEMAALCESIRARGQQTPIDVVDLGPHHPGPLRYGLISGLRRVRALQRLAAEPGSGLAKPKFDTVLALLRQPAAAADAYLAMVEENEIRVGLSYYERARIAARAAALGVHATPQAALRALFPTASRAKRSKIGSFIGIHDALDPCLRFAHAIPERLGLALSHALERDGGLGPRLIATLSAQPPATEAQEMAVLARALRPALPDPAAAAAGAGSSAPAAGEQIAPGLWLAVVRGAGGLRLTLSGPGIDAGFADRLKQQLKDGLRP